MLFVILNNHTAGQKLHTEKRYMKQENYAAYTMLTNSALSNALALELIIEAYIDEQKTEILESAFSIASDQLTVARNIREISDDEIIPSVIKLSARTIAVYLMVSTLSENTDCGEASESAGELPEAILTMIQSCILVIKTIRCNMSDK